MPQGKHSASTEKEKCAVAQFLRLQKSAIAIMRKLCGDVKATSSDIYLDLPPESSFHSASRMHSP